MIVNKYVCDFCGKDCDREGYVVPGVELKTVEAKNSEGVKITQFTQEKLIQKQIDICVDCKFKVVRLLELVPHIDLSRHSISLIDMEDD